MELPANLSDFLQDEHFILNTNGLSDALVYESKHYILKIQERQENVVDIISKLKDVLPLSEVIFYQDPYLLMSKVKGKASYEYLETIDSLLIQLSNILKTMWSIDTSHLELVNQLEEKKKKAISHIQDNYYGFDTKKELIDYINNYQDKLVLSHGDFCLPNIFIDQDQYYLIDLETMGLNSKWCDISLCLRSLKYNLEGYYGGRVYPDYDVYKLLEYLGIEFSDEQIRYHLILDSLL